MKRTAIPGLHYWSEFQVDRGIDFNGFYWARESGGVLIDPMPLADGEIEGDVAWIVLTNADHLRASAELRERFGARVLAPACDRQALAAAPIDSFYGPGDPLPPELAADIEVRWVSGGKTETEAVLYLEPLRAIVFGDVVRAHDSGVLRLLPDPKLQDRAAVVRDVAALVDCNFTALLLGDGDPIFTGAKGAFLDFVRELSGQQGP